MKSFKVILTGLLAMTVLLGAVSASTQTYPIDIRGHKL